MRTAAADDTYGKGKLTSLMLPSLQCFNDDLLVLSGEPVRFKVLLMHNAPFCSNRPTQNWRAMLIFFQ